MTTAANPRRNDLAKIHIARKALALTDADYQALIGKLTKGRTSSAADLDVRERGMLLAHFRKSGFKPAPKRKPQQPYSRTPSAAAPMARKARALWLWGADLGLVRDRSERALNHFAAPITGASDLAFTDNAGLYKAVEAIKAMLMRSLPELCNTLRSQVTPHLMRIDPHLAQQLITTGQIAEATRSFDATQRYHALLLQALGQLQNGPAAKTAHGAKNGAAATDVPAGAHSRHAGPI